MTEQTILRVAVPAPIRQALDYLPPLAAGPAAVPGMRVVVPLGSRKLMGIVVEVATQSALPAERLKPAISLPDTEPLLPPDVLELCQFAARYYHAPPGEALVGTLPASLRNPAHRGPRAGEELWEARPESHALPADALRRAPRQALALAFLQEKGPVSSTACRSAGFGPSILRALADRGLAGCVAAGMASDSDRSPAAPTTSALDLNPEQHLALRALCDSIGSYRCSLLEGITGSGKTEVYLRFIEELLGAGRQALVLVPEIGLTPQTRQRFAARFGGRVGVLHSGLGDRERLQTWRDAASGRLGVLIGTRSALFTPLPALGGIVVDEEHDASFKQQDGFRYSARDLAVYRARQLGIPIVLGSATPSTESLANCRANRFQHLHLSRRAGDARPPTARMIDIRGKTLDGGLCAELLSAIDATLARREQVLVFLNRRGWAPLLSCADCGWMAECGRCDARLTLHRAESLLWCHHCDARSRAPTECPACRSARLLELGAGTERSEHTLQRHFPGIPVRRIDRGTVQGAEGLDALAGELAKGEPCILVGTQMLAKGHHFPLVTLAAIVDIDGGLFSADFRAAERTGQLLLQVAGRAGRAGRPGEVIVQTLHPAHPWLSRLLGGGYKSFIEPILIERERLGLPPFSHLAVLRVESPEAREATLCLSVLKRELLAAFPMVEIVGPVPAALARRAGNHRVQLVLKHATRGPLHGALELACDTLEARKWRAGERWHVDVDPVEGA